jgi:hypothetical protein
VTDVLFSLLNTAQVKIGRRDARLFIDLSGLVHEHARRYVPGELATQVDQALAQLRLGQVRAEGELAKAGAQPEPHDLSETPAGPAGTAGTAGPLPAAPPPQPSPASRLWIPGRDL